MATKRGAGRQLTADNWDEPDEGGEGGEGQYEAAAPDILRARTIRTARRRNPPPQDEEKKGIFSGFSGFGKAPSSTPTASFNFISSLLNGKNDDKTTKKAEPINFNFTPKTPAADAKLPPNNTFNPIKPNDSKKDDDKTNSTPLNKTEPSKPADNDIPKGNEEYYSNLKNLNLSVLEWIQSHVEKNPYCILTPIFDDYTNYLKELGKSKTENAPDAKKSTSISEAPPSLFKSVNIPDKKIESSPKFDKPSSAFTATFASPKANDEEKSAETKTPGFFGQGFSSTPISKAPMFSFGQKSTSPLATPSTGFSLGGGKPFPFGNSAPKESAPSQAAEDEESDEPPKATFTPVVEEDSVFSKRCKVFIKKDDTFGDRGIGTLFIKPIKDSEKYQLIVRADTSLGNLLLNIVLSESIPTQRTGKNNVMLVCIPLSDVGTQPVPTLLRVKTAEEADGLLETLNKFKR